MRFHLLNTEEPKPERFTYPFPPVSFMCDGCREVQTYIAAVDEMAWQDR